MWERLPKKITMIEKNNRILDIYTHLINGGALSKSELALKYETTQKSIQRDLDDIREYLAYRLHEEGYQQELIYDQVSKCYRLEKKEEEQLTSEEILSICKILLDSRAFTKKEMKKMLEKLITGCTQRKNLEIIKSMISNELFHYIELQHKKIYMDKLWDIASAIHESRIIEITYIKPKGNEQVERRVYPVAVMFSEYYFYLTAFIENIDKKQFQVPEDPYPTIYRIDRIEKVNITEDHFKIPYQNRFDEGEFRKRVQFMYGGKLQHIKFLYKGVSAESVLDRLPTAKVLEQDENGFVISAEVFGKGIEMWIRSQGDMVEILNENSSNIRK